jgi:hypothetical protein
MSALFRNDLRAALNIDHVILQASLALATIGMFGWPVFAAEIASRWLAPHMPADR